MFLYFMVKNVSNTGQLLLLSGSAYYCDIHLPAVVDICLGLEVQSPGLAKIHTVANRYNTIYYHCRCSQSQNFLGKPWEPWMRGTTRSLTAVREHSWLIT